MRHPGSARRLCLIALVVAAGSIVHGQLVLTPEYERVRRYEGISEAEGGTLQIVAARWHHGIMATGSGGQKIFLWPALDLVVMTGGNYNTQSPANTLAIKYILPALGAGR
jgi:hypothetical protein